MPSAIVVAPVSWVEWKGLQLERAELDALELDER
jgi:hypothetical protein